MCCVKQMDDRTEMVKPSEEQVFEIGDSRIGNRKQKWPTYSYEIIRLHASCCSIWPWWKTTRSPEMPDHMDV